MVVAAAAAAMVAVGYAGYLMGGPEEGGVDEFLSFRNLTSFSDSDVWGAYRFAVDNPGDVLDYIPCFCGCVAHGDSDNRDCYIDGFDGQGRPLFDPHAAG